MGGKLRHKEWWYPRRCELPGCEARGEGLPKCGACSMVVYCCKEHQQQDWSAHKRECAVFKRLGMRAMFYNDEEMLERYPLGSALGQHPRRGGAGRNHAQTQAVPPGSCCGMCGRSSAEETLGRTECCREVVCDNEERYPVGSFSRDFCCRSHTRYTLCGNHGVESECTRGVDWRVCRCCAEGQGYYPITSDRLWRGLNGYNYYPLLEKDVPKHSLCEKCATCGKLILTGIEGAVRIGSRDFCSMRCVPAGLGMPMVLQGLDGPPAGFPGF